MKTAIHNWLDCRTADAISVRIQRDRSDEFPVLLLEPDLDNALRLASRLEAQGFHICIEVNTESALRAMKKSFFFSVVVVADLTDRNCLVALKALRRNAMRSWMIVATPCCDVHASELIHRYGGDACIAAPISPDDLIDRLDAFRIRARPTF